ncbi:hypothetical protein BpHYR1_002457 [Brachionus plicatilis]|uniref:Uncharacterized protein n=1 Tax=Brachionus plicatilis TaxID=10195 RepID=A0A3M7SAZ2_BRAPC|nr:hypothetical protein BpHYR1_002457 [Brachionus plicatilis]
MLDHNKLCLQKICKNFWSKIRQCEILVQKLHFYYLYYLKFVLPLKICFFIQHGFIPHKSCTTILLESLDFLTHQIWHIIN